MALTRAQDQVSRRAVLGAAVIFGAAMSRPGRARSSAPESGLETIPAYLESLARPDGGYAWEHQEHSHLTPTFAVVGSYYLLKTAPPRPNDLAAFVRTHHPSELKKLEQERRLFLYQQAQALAWLGADTSALQAAVRAWRRPVVYLKQYERNGCPVFQSELAAVTCRLAMGMSLDEISSEFLAYLDSRRRPNGTYNNTPATDGSDGHVMNTWWGIQAASGLGRLAATAETAEWLRACQLAGGGFTYHPKPGFAGVDDVAYTRAAVRALAALNSRPAEAEACIEWLASLANADGGFGDRPGWASNPMATYLALDALMALGALGRLAMPTARPHRAASRPSDLPSDLDIFSVQLEAHGSGSPAEAVELAAGLGIHLWGAKNAAPAWMARAQGLADEHRAPVQFVVSDEEYGTWLNVPGLGTYSHISDIIGPAGGATGKTLAGAGAVSWEEFRKRRLGPLRAGGGRLIWQFGENEELVRLLLDDSLERGGYAAISTYHFGNPDFTNSEPFLQRWRGRIPFVALQDAHGDEPWWFADMTTGFRTLFLANEPTWEGWLRALERNWVVAVRRDALSGFATWMHGGSRELLDFVRQREAQWRWWNKGRFARPMVSVVAVRAEDEFEVARPPRGVAIRVRCAWENTAQGQLKRPIVELTRLVIDGSEVKPSFTTRPGRPGSAGADAYHWHPLDDLAPGLHEATATVRAIASGEAFSRTVTFRI